MDVDGGTIHARLYPCPDLESCPLSPKSYELKDKEEGCHYGSPGGNDPSERIG